MRKPFAMTTRQTIAATTKMNNMLPWFPRATQASKFNKAKLPELMECMLPKEFQVEFDKKGHIATDHDKQCSIKESETVERNQETCKSLQGELPKKRVKTSFQKQTRNFYSPTKKHCSHHGKVKGHDSEQCWVLHPELKPQPDSNQKQGLSNNAA